MTIAKAQQFSLPYYANAQTGSYDYHNGNGMLDIYNTTTTCVCPSGRICVTCHDAYWGEPIYFVNQLYASGFSEHEVNTSTSDLSQSSIKLDFGKGYLAASSSTINKGGYFLGMATSLLNTHWMRNNAADGAFTPMQAKQYDEKFDDGSPEFGQIVAGRPFPSGFGFVTDVGTETGYTRTCVTGSAGSLTYDLSTSPDEPQCQLWVDSNVW